jgi:Putative prokaryotic signal transducing protein
MWTCPKCHTKVDPSFDVCWNCGTSVDGVEDPTFVKADDEVGPMTGGSVSPELNVDDKKESFGELPEPTRGDLVEAYLALDLMEATFLADQLNAAGIHAVSDTYDLHDALGSMDSGPRVWVRADDLARARAWLETYDRNKATTPGD